MSVCTALIFRQTGRYRQTTKTDSGQTNIERLGQPSNPIREKSHQADQGDQITILTLLPRPSLRLIVNHGASDLADQGDFSPKILSHQLLIRESYS